MSSEDSTDEHPYRPYYISRYTVQSDRNDLSVSLHRPVLAKLGAAPGDKIIVQEYRDNSVVLSLDEYGLTEPGTEISDTDEEYEWRPQPTSKSEGVRVTWCESPQQRGDDISDIPVRDGLDPDAYRAYKCRSCRDDCINLRKSVPAQHKICWSCLKVPDPKLPSYHEAVEHQRQLVERQDSTDLDWSVVSGEA